MPVITKAEVPGIIKTGQFVTVEFRKKDGSIRTLTGRTGVKKHTKGGELKYNPAERGLIGIWETTEENRKNEKDAGYRMISIDRLLNIRANGQFYRVV